MTAEFYNNFEKYWEDTKQDSEEKLPTKELFFISDKGRIRQLWHSPAIYGNLVRGYRKYGSKYNIAVHRAVCVVFTGLPEPGSNKVTVDHLNGNPQDNRKENLGWASMAEQKQRSWALNPKQKTSSSVTGKPVEACEIGTEFWIYYPTEQAAADACGTTQGNVSNTCSGRFKSSMGFKFRFADTGVVPVLDGEKWKQAIIGVGNTSAWMVSNFGRVKSPTGIISFGSKTIDGYRKITTLNHPIFVHNMVGYTFFGPPPLGMINPTIDHMDHDRSNNNVVNLQWATKREQAINRVVTKKEEIPTIIYGRKIGELRFTTYNSLDAAAKILFVNKKRIIACCRGEEESAHGYEFKTDALEYCNLPGEVWKQFFVEHYNALKALPEPTRDVENDKKRRLDYRAKRKEQHAIIKENYAAKKRKLSSE